MLRSKKKVYNATIAEEMQQRAMNIYSDIMLNADKAEKLLLKNKYIQKIRDHIDRCHDKHCYYEPGPLPGHLKKRYEYLRADKSRRTYNKADQITPCKPEYFCSFLCAEYMAQRIHKYDDQQYSGQRYRKRHYNGK